MMQEQVMRDPVMYSGLAMSGVQGDDAVRRHAYI